MTPPAESPFTAIASAPRRRILDLLRERERTAGALVEALGMTQPAVSQHLTVLKSARLVGERREGRFRFYRLVAAPLAEVSAWVQAYEQLWTERLAALDRVLEETDDEGGQ